MLPYDAGVALLGRGLPSSSIAGLLGADAPRGYADPAAGITAFETLLARDRTASLSRLRFTCRVAPVINAILAGRAEHSGAGMADRFAAADPIPDHATRVGAAENRGARMNPRFTPGGAVSGLAIRSNRAENREARIGHAGAHGW